MGVKSRQLMKLVGNPRKKTVKITGLKGLTTAAETTIGNFILPAKCIVHNVYVDITTLVAGKTIDVGTLDKSNDPDGFLDGVSTAVLGRILGKATRTTGSNEVYYSSTTRGVLLVAFTAGSDAVEDEGTHEKIDDTTSDGATLTYTPQSGTAALVFDLYIEFTDLS